MMPHGIEIIRDKSVKAVPPMDSAGFVGVSVQRIVNSELIGKTTHQTAMLKAIVFTFLATAEARWRYRSAALVTTGSIARVRSQAKYSQSEIAVPSGSLTSSIMP